jgi:hypothetical protein
VFLAELERLAGRVRHPALTLVSFLAEPVEVDESIADPDEMDLLAAGATPEDLHAASLRRAAVIYTANLVIARCMDDLTLRRWDPQTHLPASGLDEDEQAFLGDEATFVWEFFPPRFRAAYTRDFHSRVLISAVKVAYDLARPDGGPAACLVEELILDAVCQILDMTWDLAGLGRPWLDPAETLLEDTDFEQLFAADMDGIESDPATQADLRMWIPGPVDWFTPFNDDRVVHPYCETGESSPGANDLHRLLDEDTYDQIHEPAVVDDPRPITGMAPISETVGQARQECGLGGSDHWVPDPIKPDASYAQVVELTSGAASGWLTWQPAQGVEAIRTQPVALFRPHRHFPVGPDQPWAEVAVTATVMCVPLAAVVAFRPDPGVRDYWERTWSDLTSGQ